MGLRGWSNTWAMALLTGAFLLSGCKGEPHGSVPAASETATQSLEAEVMRPADYVAQPVAAPPQQPDDFPTFVPPQRQPQELTLAALPVTDGPTIDGLAHEPLWNLAPALTTLDYSSQRPITLKSVYTDTEVFFLVTYPDAAPSETHKTWMWDAQEGIYREGPDREDVFVFKWSMSGNNVSLALRDAEPHYADIWFWKAKRSNPAGYADDKTQYISLTPAPNVMQIPSKPHGTVYFRRLGDSGQAPYQERYFYTYMGDWLSQYDIAPPTGSRGDVRAKGVWSDGQWTIEFARKLNTGHDDDLALSPGHTYLFGVGCYAMAFDTPHPQWSQSLYRTGDVFDRLLFTMLPRDDK